MAYFPDKTTVQTELRENTHEADLSCVHLTTASFFELNIGYYRENTPREHWESTTGIFARPKSMQAPVMGEATLKYKNYYVPYRIISPQWNDFITKSPHVCYNQTTGPIQVTEMPYFTARDMINLFTNAQMSQQTQTNEDFTITGGTKYQLTHLGRHALKIFNQLGYQLTTNPNVTEHFDAMPLLAFAKVYCDYYTTNQYSQSLQDVWAVEQLFKKDNLTPYHLTDTDLAAIILLTQYVKYSPDYFTSQWDNPTAPNEVSTSLGNITINDITTGETNKVQARTSTYSGTPVLLASLAGSTERPISQYAIESLKGLTDFVKRMQISTKAIDRYLARFGVMLTNEKMNRSIYNGEQNTPMNFGAIYSTAETQYAQVGDYAGQGIINSEGNVNKFEFDELDEFGCIISLFSINPKIGYFQGIDRQHLQRNAESYFNGQWDSLGTQATSASELYVSMNGDSIYSGQGQYDAIFGYLPRQAQYKVGKDRLTGDFRLTSLNAGAEAWHMFRIIDENQYNQATLNMQHSPNFVQPDNDAEQYNRIFNFTDIKLAGDPFNIILTHNVKARIHAKPLYDSYDFEGEGKKIIMDGQGAKQN